MFLHRYLSSVAQRFLQKYVTILPENLRICFHSRSISLSNVEVIHKVVGESYSLSLKVSIKSIMLKFPLTFLYRGQCELIIEDPKFDIFPEEVEYIKSLNSDSILENILSKLPSSSSQLPEKKSMLSRVAKHFIKNICVTICNLKVIFVDTQKCWKGKDAAVSVSVREICCKSINLDPSDDMENKKESHFSLHKKICISDVEALATYKEQVDTFIDCQSFSTTVAVEVEKNSVAVVGFGGPIKVTVSLLLLKALNACLSSLLINTHLCLWNVERPNLRPSPGDSLTAQRWWRYAYYLSKRTRNQKISFAKVCEYRKNSSSCYHYYLSKYNAPWCTDQHEEVLGSIKLHRECSRRALIAIDHYSCTGEILNSQFLTEYVEQKDEGTCRGQKISLTASTKLEVRIEDIILPTNDIQLDVQIDSQKIKMISCCVKSLSFNESSDIASEGSETEGNTIVDVLACDANSTLKWIIASEKLSVELSNNTAIRAVSFLFSVKNFYEETAFASMGKRAFREGSIESRRASVELIFDELSIKIGMIEVSVVNMKRGDLFFVEKAKLWMNNTSIIDCYCISINEHDFRVVTDKLFFGNNLEEVENFKETIKSFVSQVSFSHRSSTESRFNEEPFVFTAHINEMYFGNISLRNVDLEMEILDGLKLRGESCGIITPSSKYSNGTLRVDLWTDSFLKDYPEDKTMERDGIGFFVLCNNFVLTLDDQLTTELECLFDFVILVLFESEDRHIYLRDPSLVSNYISGRIQVSDTKLILDEVTCCSQILPAVTVEASGSHSLNISVGRTRDKDLRISAKLGDGVSAYLRDVQISPINILPFRKNSFILLELHLSAPTRSHLFVFPFSRLKLNVTFNEKAVALHIPTLMGLWRHFDVSGSPLFRIRSLPSRIHFSNRPSRNCALPARSPNSSFVLKICEDNLKKINADFSSEQVGFGEGILSPPLFPMDLVINISAKESVLYYPWNESDASHSAKVIYLFTILHKFSLFLFSREGLTRLELRGECDVPRIRCSTTVIPEDDPTCYLESGNQHQQQPSFFETAVLVKLIYTFSRESTISCEMSDSKTTDHAAITTPKEELFLSLNGTKRKDNPNNGRSYHEILAFFSPQEVASFVTMTTSQLALQNWKMPGFQQASENTRALSFSLHLSPIAIQIPCLGFALVLWNGLIFKVNTLFHTSELKLQRLSCILHESLVFRSPPAEVNSSTRNSKLAFDSTFHHLRRLNKSEYAFLKVFSSEELKEYADSSTVLRESDEKAALTRLSLPYRGVEASASTLWVVQTGVVTFAESLLGEMQKIRTLHYLKLLQKLVTEQRAALNTMAADEIESWEHQCEKMFLQSCSPSSSDDKVLTSGSPSSFVPPASMFSFIIETLHVRVAWKSQLQLLPQDSTCLIANFHTFQFGESSLLHKFSSCPYFAFPTFSVVSNRKRSEEGAAEWMQQRSGFPVRNGGYPTRILTRSNPKKVSFSRNSLPVSYLDEIGSSKRVLLLKEGDISLLVVSSSKKLKKENSALKMPSFMSLFYSSSSTVQTAVDTQCCSIQCIPVLRPFCIYPEKSPSFTTQNTLPKQFGDNSLVSPVCLAIKISPLSMKLTRTCYLLLYECGHRISEVYNRGLRKGNAGFASSSFVSPLKMESPLQTTSCQSCNEGKTSCGDMSFSTLFSQFPNPEGAYLEWALRSQFSFGNYACAIHKDRRGTVNASGSNSRHDGTEKCLDEEKKEENRNTSATPLLTSTAPHVVSSIKGGPHCIKHSVRVYVEELRVTIIDIPDDPGINERYYWQELESTYLEEKQEMFLYFLQAHWHADEDTMKHTDCQTSSLFDEAKDYPIKPLEKEGEASCQEEKPKGGERIQSGDTMLQLSCHSPFCDEKIMQNCYQNVCNVFTVSINGLYPLPSSFLSSEATTDKMEEAQKVMSIQYLHRDRTSEEENVGRNEVDSFNCTKERRCHTSRPLFDTVDCSRHGRLSFGQSRKGPLDTMLNHAQPIGGSKCSRNKCLEKYNRRHLLEFVVGPVAYLGKQDWKNEAKMNSSVEVTENSSTWGLFVQNITLQLHNSHYLLLARKVHYRTGIFKTLPPCSRLPTVGNGRTTHSTSPGSSETCVGDIHSIISSGPLINLPSPGFTSSQVADGEKEERCPALHSCARQGMEELVITVNAGSLASVVEFMIERPARVLEEAERVSFVASPPSLHRKKSESEDDTRLDGEPGDDAENACSKMGLYSSFSRLHRITGESWTLTEDMLLARQHVQGHLLFFSHVDTNHLTVYLQQYKFCLNVFSSSDPNSFGHRHSSLSWKDQIVIIIEEGLTVTFVGGAIQFPFEAKHRAELASEQCKQSQRTIISESFYQSAEFLLQPYITLGEGSFFQCENVRCIFSPPSCATFESSLESCFSDERRVESGKVSYDASSKIERSQYFPEGCGSHSGISSQSSKSCHIDYFNPMTTLFHHNDEMHKNPVLLAKKKRKATEFSISSFSFCAVPSISQAELSFLPVLDCSLPSTTLAPTHTAYEQYLLITGSLVAEWRNEDSLSRLYSRSNRADKHNASVSLQNVTVGTVHAHHPQAGWSPSDTTIVKNWSLDANLFVEDELKKEYCTQEENDSSISKLNSASATLCSEENNEVKSGKNKNTFLSSHLSISVGELKEVEVTYQDLSLVMTLYDETQKLYAAKRYMRSSAVEREFLQLLEEQWEKSGVPMNSTTQNMAVETPSTSSFYHEVLPDERGYSAVLILPKAHLRISNHRSPLLTVGTNAIVAKVFSHPMISPTTFPKRAVSYLNCQSKVLRHRQRSLQVSELFFRVFGLGSWDEVVHPTARLHCQQNILPSSQHTMLQLDGVEIVSSMHILRKIHYVQRQFQQFLQSSISTARVVPSVMTNACNTESSTSSFSSLTPPFFSPFQPLFHANATTTPGSSPSLMMSTAPAAAPFCQVTSPFCMPSQSTFRFLLSSLQALGCGNLKKEECLSHGLPFLPQAPTKKKMRIDSCSATACGEALSLLPLSGPPISAQKRGESGHDVAEEKKEKVKNVASFSFTLSSKGLQKEEERNKENLSNLKSGNESAGSEKNQFSSAPDTFVEVQEPRSSGMDELKEKLPPTTSLTLSAERSHSSLASAHCNLSRDGVPPVPENASETPFLSSSSIQKGLEMRSSLPLQPFFIPYRYTNSKVPITHSFINSLHQNLYLLLFPLPREKINKRKMMQMETKREKSVLSGGTFVSLGANEDDDDPVPKCVSQLTDYELVAVSSMGTVSLSIPYKKNEDLYVCVLTERCVSVSSESPEEKQIEVVTMANDEGVQLNKMEKETSNIPSIIAPVFSSIPVLSTASSSPSHVPSKRITKSPNISLPSPIITATASSRSQCPRLNFQETKGLDLKAAGIRLSEIQYGTARGLVANDFLIILSCTEDDDKAGLDSNGRRKKTPVAGSMCGGAEWEEEVDVIQVRIHAKTTLRNETGCTLQIHPCNVSTSPSDLPPPTPALPVSLSFPSSQEKKKEQNDKINLERMEMEFEKDDQNDLTSSSNLSGYDPRKAGVTLYTGDSYAVFDLCNALHIRFEQSCWIYEATLLLESSTSSSFLSLFPRYRSTCSSANTTLSGTKAMDSSSHSEGKSRSMSSVTSSLSPQWENIVLIRENRFDQRPVVFYVAVELVGNHTSVNIVLLPRLTVVNAVGLPLRFTLWQTDLLAGPPSEVDRNMLEEWQQWSYARCPGRRDGGEPPAGLSALKSSTSTSAAPHKHFSMPGCAKNASPLTLIGAHSSLQHEESLSILQCTPACNLYLGIAFTQPTGEVISTPDGSLVKVCDSMKHAANSHYSPPVDVHLQIRTRRCSATNMEDEQYSITWRRERNFHLLVTIRPRQIIFSVAMWVCNMTPYSLRLSDYWWSKKMVAGVNEVRGIPPSEGSPFPLGVLLYRFDAAFLQIGFDAEWSTVFSPIVGATGVIESRENTSGIIRSCNYTIYFPNAKAHQPAVMLLTPRWVFCNLTSKRLRVFLDYPGLKKVRERGERTKKKLKCQGNWWSRNLKKKDEDEVLNNTSVGTIGASTSHSSFLYSESSTAEAEELSDVLESQRMSMVTSMTTFYLKPNDYYVSCVGPVVGNCVFLQEDLEGIVPSIEVLGKNGRVANPNAQHVGMFFEAQRTDAIAVDIPGEKRFNLWASPTPSQAQIATWHGSTVTAYPKAALLPFFPHRVFSMFSTKKKIEEPFTATSPRRDSHLLLEGNEKGGKKCRKKFIKKRSSARAASCGSTTKARSTLSGALLNTSSSFSSTCTSTRSCSSYSSTLLPSFSSKDYLEKWAKEKTDCRSSSLSSCSSSSSTTVDQSSSFSSFSSQDPSSSAPPPSALTLSNHSYGSAAITTGRMSVKVTPAHNSMLLVYFRPVVATQICIHNRTLKNTIVVRQEGNDRRSFVPSRQNRYFSWEEASGEHVLLVHQLGCKGVWYRVDFTSGECKVRYEQETHRTPFLKSRDRRNKEQDIEAPVTEFLRSSTSHAASSIPFYVSALTHSSKSHVMIIVTSAPVNLFLSVGRLHLHTPQGFSTQEDDQVRSSLFASAVTSTSTVIQLSSLQIQHYLQGAKFEDSSSYDASLCNNCNEDKEDDQEKGSEEEVPTGHAALLNSALSSPSTRTVTTPHASRTAPNLSVFSSSVLSSPELTAKSMADQPLISPPQISSPLNSCFSLVSQDSFSRRDARNTETAFSSPRNALLLCVSELTVESVEAGNTQTSRLAMLNAQLLFQQLHLRMAPSSLLSAGKSSRCKMSSKQNASLNRPVLFRAVGKLPASLSSSGVPLTEARNRYCCHTGVMNAFFSRLPENINQRYMIEGHYNLVKYPDGMQRITEGAVYFAPLMISVQDKDLAHCFREIREVQQFFTFLQSFKMRSATISPTDMTMRGNALTSALLPVTHFPPSALPSLAAASPGATSTQERQRDQRTPFSRATLFCLENMHPSVYLSHIILHYQVEAPRAIVEESDNAPRLSRHSSRHVGRGNDSDEDNALGNRTQIYSSLHSPHSRFYIHHHEYPFTNKRSAKMKNKRREGSHSPSVGTLVSSHHMESKNEEDERFLRIDSLHIGRVTVFISFIRDPVKDPLRPFFGSYTLMLPNRMDQTEVSLRAFSLAYSLETMDSLHGKLRQWCRQGLREQWAKLTKLGAVLKFLKRSGRPSLQLRPPSPLHEQSTPISFFSTPLARNGVDQEEEKNDDTKNVEEVTKENN